MLTHVGKILSKLQKVLQAGPKSSASRPGNQLKIKGMSACHFATPVTVEEINYPRNVIRLAETNFELLVNRGAEAIKSGGVIAVPTDTVYGIASDAQNNSAIERIYNIKGRDCRKPIAICVHSIDQVYQWGKITVPRSLLEEILPGPVTLVFQRQPQLNTNLNPTTDLIGIRIPDNQFIISLAKIHKGPIALTSANLSASPSTLEVSEFENLWPLLDIVFDGGRLSNCEETEKAARAGSTVIDLSQVGLYRIIREGTAHIHYLNILQNNYSLKEQLRN